MSRLNILFFSPGYPDEMGYFARCLARCGVNVIGLGEHPPAALPDVVRPHLADYVQVRSLMDRDPVRERDIARLAVSAGRAM